MKYIYKFWEWIKTHSGALIVGLLFALWIFANGLSFKSKQEKSVNNFQCSTACFPQQNEYIYHGSAGSCWCYNDKSTLKKLEK